MRQKSFGAKLDLFVTHLADHTRIHASAKIALWNYPFHKLCESARISFLKDVHVFGHALAWDVRIVDVRHFAITQQPLDHVGALAEARQCAPQSIAGLVGMVGT
jgi:hypothetical protein